MTYACDDCGLLFFRIFVVTICPLCGGAHVRCATKEERQTLHTSSKKKPTQVAEDD